MTHSTTIHYKNQPKLSEHEVDQKFNNRRIELIPKIDNFILADDLFKNKQISVEFSHQGVSSLVCFIQADDKKYVLKIPLSLKFSEGEGLFLKTWEAAGVVVPHVFKEGKIDDYTYILMAFVEAPVLKDVREEYGDDTSIELGKILRSMHAPKVNGYGPVIGGKPQYAEFKGWIQSESMQERIHYTEEHSLLENKEWPVSKVLETLVTYCEKDGTGSYCHFDFGAANILATKPFTVIDPNPMFNNGIIDLGRTMLLAIAGGSYKAVKYLEKGYFFEEETFDPKVLQASIILNAYMKFVYWHKKGRLEGIERVRQYLD